MGKLLTIIIAVGFIVGLSYASCQTDGKCMMDCQGNGYSYGYCKSYCSYCEEE